MDRQRILGARVIASEDGRTEAIPGDTITLETLAWSPEGEPERLIMPCLPTPGASCPDPALLESAKGRDFADVGEQAWGLSNGLIGVEPLWMPAFPLSEDVLQGQEQIFLPVGLAGWVEGSDVDDEFAQVTVVLRQTLTLTPNHAPSPPRLTFDGATPSASGEELVGDRGQVVRLEARPVDDPETYQVDGETYEETFRYRWYSDLGELTEAGLGFDGFADEPERDRMDWTLPDETSEGELLLVVRDGRGGVSWSSWTVRVQ